MFRTLTLAAAALVAATSIAAANDDIFVSLAMQDDDRAAVRALRGQTGAGVAFSSKGGSISALEVAYKHALENDDRQLAKHLAAKLGL